MITISVVMIVKNEERCLRDCLDSIKHIADEIIVVDTGSTDKTKAIAQEYTQKIYDFAWTGRFCDARNYAFSKANCDYIYSADADESLDEENREELRVLKDAMLPEVEIVQMYYTNQLENGTVYNFDKELRPKLFKRLREFTWIEPIHETVRTDPVVYNSDIEIIHKPANSHAARDLECFEAILEKEAGLSSKSDQDRSTSTSFTQSSQDRNISCVEKRGNDGTCMTEACEQMHSFTGRELSERLHEFYAREVFMLGEKEHLRKAVPYFEAYCNVTHEEDKLKTAYCVLAKAGFELEDDALFYKYAMKAVTLGGCAEICTLLGEYYYKKKDFTESQLWFYNGAYETESILDIRYHESLPLEGLKKCDKILV